MPVETFNLRCICAGPGPLEQEANAELPHSLCFRYFRNTKISSYNFSMVKKKKKIQKYNPLPPPATPPPPPLPIP